MKIHFVSNSIFINSGFGKVTRYLAQGLQRMGHECTMTGLQTAQRIDCDFGINCYPIDSGGHVDESTQLFLNLQNIKPDVLIYVGQVDADLNHLLKVFNKQVVYCPTEGRNVPDMMINDLKDVIKRGGKIVAQCKYGYDEMTKAGVEVDRYIYHGVDPEIFYPMQDREQEQGGGIDEKVSILKFDGVDKKWKQNDINIKDLEMNIGRDKFVYSFTGQNFGLRKQIPRLLKAYSMLVKSGNRQIKDRSMLVMHTLPMSIRGVNLIRTVHQLGIQDNVIFTYGTFGSSGWSENAMNIWYNLADVNVSASSSEGWGLPTGESMACGKVNIGPNCSSFTELIGNSVDESKNRGLLANIATYHQIQDGSERALVDEFDLASKMRLAFIEKDKEKMETFRMNGIEFMRNYTWNKIVSEWDSMLREFI